MTAEETTRTLANGTKLAAPAVRVPLEHLGAAAAAADEEDLRGGHRLLLGDRRHDLVAEGVRRVADLRVRCALLPAELAHAVEPFHRGAGGHAAAALHGAFEDDGGRRRVDGHEPAGADEIALEDLEEFTRLRGVVGAKRGERDRLLVGGDALGGDGDVGRVDGAEECRASREKEDGAREGHVTLLCS